MQNTHVITIDGPVGSGKSTVGRLLAKRLGFVYLDTGAMYRVVAYEVQCRGIDPDDDELLGDVCGALAVSFKQGPEVQKVFSGDRDVTEDIRSPEISMLASRVSAKETVRRTLLALQRKAAENADIVVDGRDAGTVIFPYATCKFYLDAGIKIRAERRYKELIEKNVHVEYNDILYDIRKRDEADSKRALAPLKPAKDAVVIDTTKMTIEDVLEYLQKQVEQRIPSLPYITERKRG